MALTESAPIPYEQLARWDITGKLQGVHVGFRTLIYRDGIVIADNPQPVMPVAIGDQVGFPLTDIMDRLTADALVKIDDQQAVIAARDTQIAELQTVGQDQATSISQLTAQTVQMAADIATRDTQISTLTVTANAQATTIDGMTAQVAALQQQVADLTAPPPVTEGDALPELLA